MAIARALFRGLPSITPSALHPRTLCSGRRRNPKLNEALRHLPAVRLISETGQDCGLMSGEDALRRARTAGRDVMQVSASRPPAPPVARLVDYLAMTEARRKHAYDRRKADKELRKLQRRESALKQVRLSPATDQNDLDFKVRRAQQFLLDGYRVKVFMMFRRGQGALHQTAKDTLVKVAHTLSTFGNVQGVPAGGNLQDMFRNVKRPNAEEQPSDEDQLQGEDDPPPKRTPMEVLIYPLPRKQRDNVLVDTDQHPQST